MSKPLVIGHRGASAVAPENTLAAFEAAIAAEADGIEFDVRLTRDGIPVVIHDDTLRRTAGVAKRVDELTLEDLKKVDVGSWFTRSRKLTHEQFSVQTIPSLQQLFDLFVTNDSLLYLEMKCHSFERARLAEACCRLVNDNSLKHRVIVECFDLAAIETVKRIDREIRTAALFEPALTTAPILSERRLVDKAKAVGVDEIALHYRLVSNRIVENAKLAGLTVVVWTVDNPAWIKRAKTIGIDVLITNDPARMLAHRDGI
jgi:glycerophosphoryl diester phosphodiesterase